MPRNNDLLSERNERIRNRYKELCQKHPQWRYDAIIDRLVAEFFLTTSTITKIINNE
jgi:hypothetical protein